MAHLAIFLNREVDPAEFHPWHFVWKARGDHDLMLKVQIFEVWPQTGGGTRI